MESKPLEIKKAFNYGWTEVKKNFWYFVGLAVIVMIIEGITGGTKHGRAYFNFLGIFLSAWMTCGYTQIALDYFSGNKREISDVFTQFQNFWRVLGATILVGVIVALGFILLIIPGIYLALRFSFTVNLIIDKKLGIGDAMKLSSVMTQGIKMPLLGFALTAMGVMILGAICLGVGIFVAMPVTWLAYIYLYKNISSGAVTTPVTNAPTATAP